jgi:hypothetical protein
MAKAAEASRAPAPKDTVVETGAEPAGQGIEAPQMPPEAPKSLQAVAAIEPAKAPPAPKDVRKTAKPVVAARSSNLNRITVNLFDADRRALAIIKEHLANAGQDFTNRSDCIKIGLRLAAKVKKEELAALLLEVRGEDRRFSGHEQGNLRTS